jgi:N-acyl-D-amino-acid deacylase
MLGLADRGRIAPGCWADLVLLDPQAVADRATYRQPRQSPAGIEWVLVNGQVAVESGRFTGAMAGKVLRKG